MREGGRDVAFYLLPLFSRTQAWNDVGKMKLRDACIAVGPTDKH